HIEGLINDKASYAFRRATEVACAGEEFRRYEYGSVEELAKLDGRRLADHWRALHETTPVDIYLSGAIDPGRSLDALDSLLGSRGTTTALRPLPELREAPTEPREIREELDVHQANLVLVYRTKTRYAAPTAAALIVANGILGAFPHSKLFQIVREKHSLAYSIWSYADRAQGLLFVSAGVPADRVDAARALIEAQVTDVAAGRISDLELDSTRLSLDNQLSMMEDNPGTLAAVDLAWRQGGSEYRHEDYRRAVRSVSVDDVMAAMRHVELDTVYTLCPRSKD
ncbi:MAG: insulinase family protein, partial [Planctomycetes bacterium]|nr:insulinase family protein [Planctomycetota bacterium]